MGEYKVPCWEMGQSSVNCNFLYDSNYINARNNGDYYHFGVVPVPLPTWNHVLDEFDPVVFDFLKEISKSYNSFKKNQNYTALGYISLSALSHTYGRHNDVMDVWCWNILGGTQWKVEGRKRDFEKVLEPGELIYVPRGMWHDTKPIGPRVNISFGSEDLR